MPQPVRSAFLALALTTLLASCATTSGPPSLKIASWNFERVGEPACAPLAVGQTDQLKAYLKAIDADVIAVQGLNRTEARQIFSATTYQMVFAPDVVGGSSPCKRDRSPGFAIRRGLPFERGVNVSGTSAAELTVSPPGRSPYRLLSVQFYDEYDEVIGWLDRNRDFSGALIVAGRFPRSYKRDDNDDYWAGLTRGRVGYRLIPGETNSVCIGKNFSDQMILSDLATSQLQRFSEVPTTSKAGFPRCPLIATFQEPRHPPGGV